LSKGCHQLIREGAKLVESAEDVLVELRPVLGARLAAPVADRRATAGQPASPDRGPVALDPVLESLGFDPADIDTLVGRTGLPAGEIGARLLALELDNRVERLVDGRFMRLAPGRASHL